jgi:AbrB family looped-hinge helix DNA binding protein
MWPSDVFGDAFLEASDHRFREPEHFFPLFAGEPLQFDPGEGNAYSNAGFVVLGAVIEAVTGEPYREVIEARFFKPAGMTGSGFFASDGLEPDVAVGYTALDCPDGGPIPCRSNLATKVWAGCPAGGSHSPAIDLLRFDETPRSHRLTTPEWTRWVMVRIDPVDGGTADPERATWGWAIAGGAPGVNAELDSDGRNAVVVMANLDPPIAMEIAKALRPVVEAFKPQVGRTQPGVDTHEVWDATGSLKLHVAAVDVRKVRRYLTRMKTTISSKGQIVLPAELRQEDGVEPGDQFEVERLDEGEYVLRRMKARPNRGLVALLRSCPEDDWFVPVDREPTTDDVAAPDLG